MNSNANQKVLSLNPWNHGQVIHNLVDIALQGFLKGIVQLGELAKIPGGTIYMFGCKQCNWLIHFHMCIIGWQFLDLIKNLMWSNVSWWMHCNIPHFLLCNIMDRGVIIDILDVVFYMLPLFGTMWIDCRFFACNPAQTHVRPKLPQLDWKPNLQFQSWIFFNKKNTHSLVACGVQS